MNPNVYRLHEIHEIERELIEEKLKHSAMIKKIPLLAELLHWMPFDFSFLYFSFERWVFVKFRRNHRNCFWEGFAWIERVFCKCFNFLKVIEKFLFNKIQRHEKQKTLIEMQLNSIRNMISKALLDDKISASEFEKITSQMTKCGETYRNFENVDYDNLEINKLMPKMLPKKSESFV